MRSLRSYITWLAWVGVVPLGLLAVAIGHQYVSALNRELSRDATAQAKNLASSLDYNLGHRIAALRLLAESTASTDASRLSELYEEAQVFQRSLGDHVLTTDATGRMLFHTAVPFGQALPPMAKPVGRSAVLTALQTGAPAVGDQFRGYLVRETMVAIAVPSLVASPRGLVAVSVIPTASFQQRLDRLAVKEGWSMSLLDSQGVVMARVGAAVPAASRRFTSVMTEAPWSVVLEVPEPVYQTPMLRASAAIGAAILVLMATGVVLGAVAARRISAEVQSLVTGQPGETRPGSAILEVEAARRRLAEMSLREQEALARERQGEREAHERLERSAIALQVSEAQLRGIVGSVDDAIVTVDASQRVIVANAAAAGMFQRPIEQLVGAHLGHLLPQRHRGRHEADVAAFGEAYVAPRRMGRASHVTGLRADGTEFPIEASISHVHVDGQRLYTAVLRDVTEQRQADEAARRVRAELEASHAELQRLIAAQDKIQEGERGRIARELHDDLQQTLAAIRMDAGDIAAELEAHPSGVPAMLERIDQLAAAALLSTRRIVSDLRPQMLEELGLAAALEALATQFAQRTAIDCRFGVHPEELRQWHWPDAVATCLYRVVQECLNNVAKHAGAQRVVIRLGWATAGVVRVSVEDDGRGLDEADRQKPDSYGLLGMGERVRAVGGVVRIASRPGSGTTVIAEVPLPVA